MSIYDLLIRANRDVKAGLPTVAVARLAVVIDSIVADAFQEDWTSELAIINNGQKHVVLATKQQGGET